MSPERVLEGSATLIVEVKAFKNEAGSSEILVNV
jgi:hypothetical protein